MSAVETKTLPLGQTLKHIFSNTNLKIVDILSNVDVSRSFIERLFRGKESRFDLVLSVIRFLECDENALIQQYCEEIEMPANLLYALEYCDRRNNLNMLEKLIERSEGKTLPELREMKQLYRISHQRKKDGSTENLKKALIMAKSLRPSTSVSKTFQKLVEIQIHHQLKEYGNVSNILENLEISTIDDAFFNESFQWRVNQVQQSISLRVDVDFERCRALAFELLRMSDSKYFHAYAYGNLGLCHAFTNQKEEAIRYLNKSKQLYGETGMSNGVWNETIQFFEIAWGKKTHFDEVCSTKNIALWLIKSGKSYQSIEIIDKIEQVEGISPMSLYLRGLANDDPDCHWQALEMYIKHRGDRLFAILPRNELLHLKQNKYGVNALYNILKK